MNAFIWLLKCEYWENKGGFLRAPIITAIILLSLLLLGLVAGSMHLGNAHIRLGDFPIDQLLSSANSPQQETVARGITLALMNFTLFIQFVMAFVLFFYLIGSLYDDRRDRSVLFWKSLPISDFSTVTSKVITAAITAPLIAFGVSVLLHLAILILISLFLLLNAVNPLIIWWPAELLNLWIKLLTAISINALWAMPTYGWLMFISSFARNRPLLWAILPPVMFGVLNVWFQLTWYFNLPSVWYWKNVVGRLLGSAAPFSWLVNNTFSMKRMFKDDGAPVILSWDMLGDILLSPNLWIGVIVGIVLLGGAVYFRRTRIESQS